MDALGQSLASLRPGGLLSVMCYPGHAGGDEEADAVLDWIRENDNSFGMVTCYKRAEARETAPFLIMAQKSGGA